MLRSPSTSETVENTGRSFSLCVSKGIVFSPGFYFVVAIPKEISVRHLVQL